MTLYAGLAGTLREANVVHWNSYMPPTILCNVLPLFLNICLCRDSSMDHIQMYIDAFSSVDSLILLRMQPTVESLERLIFRNGGTR